MTFLIMLLIAQYVRQLLTRRQLSNKLEKIWNTAMTAWHVSLSWHLWRTKILWECVGWNYFSLVNSEQTLKFVKPTEILDWLSMRSSKLLYIITLSVCSLVIPEFRRKGCKKIRKLAVRTRSIGVEIWKLDLYNRKQENYMMHRPIGITKFIRQIGRQGKTGNKD